MIVSPLCSRVFEASKEDARERLHLHRRQHQRVLAAVAVAQLADERDGQEVADVLVSAVVINRRGLSRERVADEFRFAYRTSNLAKDDVVVEARLRGFMDTSARIVKRMGHLEKTRSESQPTRERTGGSTFINPPQDTAWRLIENAGCRDLRRGGAAISKKHCNFLVNNGHATAADLEGLGEEVRRRVFYETGVRLAWEIRRLGCHGPTLADVGA